MSMKNSNDTIGDRTRVLPASSTVPRRAAPCAPDGPCKMAKQGKDDIYTRGRRIDNTVMCSVSLPPVGKYQN